MGNGAFSLFMGGLFLLVELVFLLVFLVGPSFVGDDYGFESDLFFTLLAEDFDG